MTTPETWISDRRALLDAATEGPWSAANENEIIPSADPMWCVSQMRRCFESMTPTEGYVGDVADVGSNGHDAALIADSRTSLPKALDALEAVLELHTPERFHDHPEKEFCRCCQRTAGVYPCRTVTAITTALGVESC